MNKVAVVTGSEGDIGRSICELLKEDSYKVIGVDIATAKSESPYVKYFQGSVIDTYLIEECFELIEELQPTDFALVNNAGVTFPDSDSIAAWDSTLDVNLKGPFLWMTAAALFLEKAKVKGSLVSITSLAAELAFPGNPSYAASKGGLSQLTKSFAYRLGALGVCCNNVVPGYIETKFNLKSIENLEKYKTRAERSLFNRWGKTSEIAQAVQFLVSDRSRFITGQDIVVDGGWTIQGIRDL